MSYHVSETPVWQEGQFPASSMHEGRMRHRKLSKNATYIKKGALTGFWRVDVALRVYKKTVRQRPMAQHETGSIFCVTLLEIPAGALIFAPPRDKMYGFPKSRKMRASEAKVIASWAQNGDEQRWSVYRETVTSIIDKDFEYRVGFRAVPKDGVFSTKRISFARGIHFFLDAADAVDY